MECNREVGDKDLHYDWICCTKSLPAYLITADADVRAVKTSPKTAHRSPAKIAYSQN
jgi:hypothetical protein